ncbi:Regulator of replication initiation timing [Pisciglobus halotolerans]|uniref:Replication initiation control protein YabA n=2 Tax=Pisciglobus halotolerans TaxID=745365 RepID=A0A1I3CNJ4_9LACT|nr:Regulator of replication initiation timing [Pisciglobus halotolerans]
MGEKMDKKALYDTFIQLENDTNATLGRISEVKNEVEALVEENATLRIENQHLRDRLSDLEKQKEISKDGIGTEMSKSRLNLEKIYEEGFHVCNVFYGSRRVNDESCAFCLDVIYGERR